MDHDHPLIFLSREYPVSCRYEQDRQRITCLDRVRAILEESAEKLGFDYIRYSYWLKDVAPQQTSTNLFGINISNFPADWELHYNENSLYLVDLVVRIIQERVGENHLIFGAWNDAYVWGMQNPLGETTEEKQKYIQRITKLIEASRDYGLMSGYYYSWGDDLRQIVLSLSSPVDGIESPKVSQNTVHSMVILTNQAIQLTKGCHHCHKSIRIDGSAPIELTSSEQALLLLYHKHRNATQRQIADCYGRSVDTVNHHLRSIRRKLNIQGASGHALASYAAELNLL